MAMKDGAGTPLNPANLWGKPDPRASIIKEEKVSRKTEDEEHLEEDVDLDAELDTAEEEFADEDGDGDFAPEAGDETSEQDENVEEEIAAEAEDADAELEPGDDDDDAAESVDDDAEDDENLAADDEVTDSVATNRKRDMAEKKTSLSDHVRAEIRRRKDSGASLRGKDIVEALARRNVKVSAAQVSQLMKKEGVPPGKPGRRAKETAEQETPTRSAFQRKQAAAPVKAPAKAQPTRAAGQARQADSSRGFRVPMAQLEAAEAFVEACGGTFEAAERILTAAAQLSKSFNG
jgi:hypothetical protein